MVVAQSCSYVDLWPTQKFRPVFIANASVIFFSSSMILYTSGLAVG